ncbi:DMT family transporter [Thiohalocapsa halophila]|uniref:DMT family transporter n=1 Tax=Thiohalocapsa halophila TaxID=69359 RepID=UPI0019037175|nr:DMT family transporter [Thiohalocapsa halophila]
MINIKPAPPTTNSPTGPSTVGTADTANQAIVIPVMLAGSTLWGLYWLPLRWLEQAGLGGLWALTFIYIGATVTLGLVARRHWPAVAAARWRLLGIGSSAAVSGIAFGLGMIEGEVARVLILFYLSPVWAVLLGRMLLGERLLAVTVPALVLALFGAGLMLLSDTRGLGQGLLRAFSAADLLGLVAGFAFALTNVQLRGARGLPSALKNLAAVALVPPLAAVAAAGVGSDFSALPWALLAALVVGVLWMSSMISATQYGVTRMPLQRSSVLLLFELIVGAVSAALIAGEALSVTELAGGGCIVLAGLAVVWLRR